MAKKKKGTTINEETAVVEKMEEELSKAKEKSVIDLEKVKKSVEDNVKSNTGVVSPAATLSKEDVNYLTKLRERTIQLAGQNAAVDLQKEEIMKAIKESKEREQAFIDQLFIKHELPGTMQYNVDLETGTLNVVGPGKNIPRNTLKK